MDRKIRLVIDQVGKARVEAEGFAGQGCVDATRAIERALAGNAEVDRSMKAEALAVEQTAEDHVHEQGW